MMASFTSIESLEKTKWLMKFLVNKPPNFPLSRDKFIYKIIKIKIFHYQLSTIHFLISTLHPLSSFPQTSEESHSKNPPIVSPLAWTWYSRMINGLQLGSLGQGISATCQVSSPTRFGTSCLLSHGVVVVVVEGGEGAVVVVVETAPQLLTLKAPLRTPVFGKPA